MGVESCTRDVRAGIRVKRGSWVSRAGNFFWARKVPAHALGVASRCVGPNHLCARHWSHVLVENTTCNAMFQQSADLCGILVDLILREN
eukprot:1031666-Ditylum_brightwellii.AAC.1